MRNKMTMKAIKTSNTVVLGVGYCDLQRTLKFEWSPAYATRVEGWACDLYEINDRYSIATGYNYSRSCTHDVLDYPELSAELDAYEKSLQRHSDIASSPTAEERKAKLIAILDKHLSANAK